MEQPRVCKNVVLRWDLRDSRRGDKAAGHEWPRRVPSDDVLLLQVTEQQRRRGAPLELIFTNKEGLVGDAEVEGSRGCGDPEMVELRMVRAGRGKAFRRADSDLLEGLLGGVPRDQATEGRGAPREPGDAEGSAPPSSRALRPTARTARRCRGGEELPAKPGEGMEEAEAGAERGNRGGRGTLPTQAGMR